jgi:RNA polymerase sigma-70 factor (ECF subfamily)
LERRVSSQSPDFNDDESALVSRAIAGDVGAFESLVRRHFRASFAIALSIMGNRADAEDVCQDAFVAAFEHLNTCREPERFTQWLFQIVRNRARKTRDYLRVRRTASLSDVAEPAGSPADTPHHHAVNADVREALSTALRALTDTQAAVVLMHDLEGWKHREIAMALGISDMMSRRHLSDARRVLRARLADHVPESSRER